MRSFFLVEVFILVFIFSSCDRKSQVKFIDKDYYNNDHKKSIVFKKKDSLSYKFRHEFFRNGKTKKKIKYKNGKFHGKQIEYYKNGKAKTIIHYKNGVKDGLIKKFYKNGILGYKGNYENGQKIGWHKLFYKNGNIKEKRYIKKGYVLDVIKFNREGERIYGDKYKEVGKHILTNDTISSGDFFKAYISISNMKYDSLEVIEVKSKKDSIDPIKMYNKNINRLPKLRYNTVIYKNKFKTYGNKTIFLLAFELNKNGEIINYIPINLDVFVSSKYSDNTKEKEN